MIKYWQKNVCIQSKNSDEKEKEKKKKKTARMAIVNVLSYTQTHLRKSAQIIKAFDLGKMSKGGRIKITFYDLCQNICAGYPATLSLSSGYHWFLFLSIVL